MSSPLRQLAEACGHRSAQAPPTPPLAPTETPGAVAHRRSRCPQPPSHPADALAALAASSAAVCVAGAWPSRRARPPQKPPQLVPELAPRPSPGGPRSPPSQQPAPTPRPVRPRPLQSLTVAPPSRLACKQAAPAAFRWTPAPTRGCGGLCGAPAAACPSPPGCHGGGGGEHHRLRQRPRSRRPTSMQSRCQHRGWGR